LLLDFVVGISDVLWSLLFACFFLKQLKEHGLMIATIGVSFIYIHLMFHGLKPSIQSSTILVEYEYEKIRL